jgi:hypothetical protein
MNQWSAVSGVTRYEFAMQLRRPSLWVGLGLSSVLLMATFGSFTTLSPGVTTISHGETLVLWTTTCSFLVTAGAGLLLADRTPRDRKTKMLELLRTSPAPTLARILGKYTGAVLATLVPIALIYAVGVGRLIALWGDGSLLPMALATFAAILVPAVLFVGAFSIACPTVLWTPLYQFLFVGYWLWTSLNPGSGQPIPTLSGTLLSPGLSYVVTGFFHFSAYDPIDKGFYPASSIALGIANIAVLLGSAILALVVAWLFQRWRANAE